MCFELSLVKIEGVRCCSAQSCCPRSKRGHFVAAFRPVWDEGWRAGSYCGINGETQFGPRLRISQVAQMYVVFALVGKVAVVEGISP